MLKQFFSLLKRYILPYRKYLTWALILNFLSQWLNVFSFMAIVPILNILFKIDTKSYEYIPMDIHNLDKDVLINNAYYFVSNFVATNGAFYTLAMMGGILIFMTMLKTAGYFASAAVMVPLRTGIVRDIRIQVYNKVLSLPLSFFSEERKGDIIARMSADVTVVELANDAFCYLYFTSDRLDNGGCQPEAEKTVLYSTGAMGRYYVPIG